MTNFTFLIKVVMYAGLSTSQISFTRVGALDLTNMTCTCGQMANILPFQPQPPLQFQTLLTGCGIYHFLV